MLTVAVEDLVHHIVAEYINKYLFATGNSKTKTKYGFFVQYSTIFTAALEQRGA